MKDELLELLRNALKYQEDRAGDYHGRTTASENRKIELLEDLISVIDHY